MSGKGKKRISETKPQLQLSNVDDAFYRLAVQDCERKIQRLRNHVENFDISNTEIKNKIHYLTEEKSDRAADLTKNLIMLDEQIYRYNEDINILSQQLADVKKSDNETISDLEEKYKAMHYQLRGELKLLKEKHQMLEDFRVAADVLSFEIAQEKHNFESQKKKYKNAIASMELKINHERALMQKAVESQLLQVSADFQLSSAVRNASYAQRLIRENIALEKEIDILRVTQENIDQQLKEHVVRCKEIKETFPALIQKKRDLIFVAHQKTNHIEKLTTKYEKLKNAYMESLLYKHQYQDAVQYRQCKHQQQHQLVTKAKKLASRAHLLKAECHYLENNYVRHEKEKARLRDVLLLIRKTILDTVNIIPETEQPAKQKLEEEILSKENTDSKDSISMANSNEMIFQDEIKFEIDEEEEESINDERYNKTLLEKLIDILEEVKNEASLTESLESVTANSFLIKNLEMTASSESIRGAFKHSTEPIDTLISESLEELQTFKQESNALIPKERIEHGLIFDVEKGSTLYMSARKSIPEIFEEKQNLEDSDNRSSGSSYESLASQKSIVKPTTPTVMTEKNIKLDIMPPGTIVDVEMVEEEEDEIDLAENENYEEEQSSPVEAGYPEEEMSIYMFY